MSWYILTLAFSVTSSKKKRLRSYGISLADLKVFDTAGAQEEKQQAMRLHLNLAPWTSLYELGL
jgi:hypothetical protein